MGVVGIIPLVDLVLQNFVIKKDAAKTVGEIFGIDVKFIDEENAKNEKKTKEVNLNYINKIVEERILDESTEYKVQETAPVQKAASSSQSAAAASSSNILCRLASIGLLGLQQRHWFFEWERQRKTVLSVCTFHSSAFALVSSEPS